MKTKTAIRITALAVAAPVIAYGLLLFFGTLITQGFQIEPPTGMTWEEFHQQQESGKWFWDHLKTGSLITAIPVCLVGLVVLVMVATRDKKNNFRVAGDIRQRLLSRRGPIGLLILGVVLCLGPFFGFAGVAGVLGVILLLCNFSLSHEVNFDALLPGATFLLWTSFAGFIAFPVGIVILVCAIIWLAQMNKRGKSVKETP